VFYMHHDDMFIELYISDITLHQLQLEKEHNNDNVSVDNFNISLFLKNTNEYNVKVY